VASAAGELEAHARSTQQARALRLGQRRQERAPLAHGLEQLDRDLCARLQGGASVGVACSVMAVVFASDSLGGWLFTAAQQ